MRNKVIALLKEKLAEHSFIYALWLEGADAHGRADAFSDLDLWIDVEDAYIADAFSALEQILEALGPLDKKVLQPHDGEEIFQCFYHIKGSSPFLLLDVCIQKHSRNITFNESNTDERICVLFDKATVLRFSKGSAADATYIKQCIQDIAAAFSVYRPKVEKHLRRGHFLSALQAYHHYVLEPLVTLMRLAVDPSKKDFYLKHVENDLPQSDRDLLTKLFTPGTLHELEYMLDEAAQELYKRIEKFK
ncbi:hypothetical protein COW46_03455 [Candidatus Gracilibacteria bacterium CG17_big_fil_post_rev_8_21_14_2_50_48_13]|nr:MAG: hypothetical protein COW46_03455 [Candidatus Gracilibacteria bacterium CG17_big_fil_post_rev_8_21_14_2_50_48_13]